MDAVKLMQSLLYRAVMKFGARNNCQRAIWPPYLFILAGELSDNSIWLYWLGTSLANEQFLLRLGQTYQDSTSYRICQAVLLLLLILNFIISWLNILESYPLESIMTVIVAFLFFA
ncbi:uncharacterized protein LOC110643972 [Hevea brasiliensis]|uniref:uncharacterized protein LOC110643972 n=1 Tax=Hevea brasiliensis TaxID=3981 RepID=UPI0025D7714F|nr:uncharacterized protein LOC110643972 [Hevea brasiliensis]XP_058008800.1 uncharacterized protein LOC110643972 [Hevea brasiliensis]XP_058008801.1 uncharacterized protein LOC110643972 [Hevea brasiliensis]